MRLLTMILEFLL